MKYKIVFFQDAMEFFNLSKAECIVDNLTVLSFIKNTDMQRVSYDKHVLPTTISGENYKLMKYKKRDSTVHKLCTVEELEHVES